MACAGPPPADLPAAWIWNKDQNLISPRDGKSNVWNGMRISGNFFNAENDSSRLILWRRQRQKLPLVIEYSLQGKAVEFSVNIRARFVLPPGRAFQKKKIVTWLSRGFNFLQFQKSAKDFLRIRSVYVGHVEPDPAPLLRAGESFSVFFPPGRGRLQLAGRGTIRIEQREFGETSPPPSSTLLHSGFFSRKIVREIAFSQPGTMTVTAVSGRFDISGYRYQNANKASPRPQAAFRGKPDIYIFLSDACQAAHLGVYGYSLDTSPHIDAFAADALVYENAYANASFTLSSVATLLTGLYPEGHQLRILEQGLRHELLTLPEYMKAKGYRTAVFNANPLIRPGSGFAQGVDDFVRVDQRRPGWQEDEMIKRFAGWLDSPPPRFAYLHFLPPHLPQVPPADFSIPFAPGEKPIRQERMIQLMKKGRDFLHPIGANEMRELVQGYDSTIAWMDVEFGKFIAHLKRKKLYDGSLIIFMADHGEAMNEHGVVGHSDNVFEETTRVPLLVKLPAEFARRGRVRRLVEIADIFPTISAWFGQKLELDGRDLPAADAAGGFDDTMTVSRSFNHCPAYGLRWKNWYYIIDLNDNGEYLYDLAVDPRRDIARARPQIGVFLKSRFLAWLARFSVGSDHSLAVNLKNLPASEIEELKTLGYL